MRLGQLNLRWGALFRLAIKLNLVEMDVNLPTKRSMIGHLRGLRRGHLAYALIA